MAALYGYADTSGKESTASDRILTVNGCLSTPERWKRLDEQWQNYLREEHFKPDSQTGRFVFHTSRFWSGNCKLMPTDLSKFAKDRIYSNLIWLICKHTEFRFGYAVQLDDYRQFEKDFPGARIITKQAGTYASRLCFNWNSAWAQGQGFDGAVDYCFDRGDEFWGEMFEEYRGFRDKGVDPTSLTVSTLVPGNKAEHSGIQAADIIAWESRKYFLGLTDDHLADRLPPLRPRRELNRLGQDNRSDIRLYRYREFVGEVVEKVEEGLEARETMDMYIGQGKAFPTVEDYARAVLAYAKNEDDETRKSLKEKWRHRKTNQQSASN